MSNFDRKSIWKKIAEEITSVQPMESALSFGERFHRELEIVLEKIKEMDAQTHGAFMSFFSPQMTVPAHFIDVTVELAPKKTMISYPWKRMKIRFDKIELPQIKNVDPGTISGVWERPELHTMEVEPKPLEIPKTMVFGYEDYIPKRPAAIIADPSRYPHQCPRCSAPAYIGLMTVDCSRKSCS